ncbi:MAG: pyridoxal phosphate-dependent aminotransferase [Chloroflexaceae bacterium]|jgi:aspartate/methionine/tyrosine aminotransferase|nr:pyridoxal phosphate-dependent aminotransferase [Chloroflexaceae bacterium]
MPGSFDNLDLSPNRIEQTRQRVAATTGYLDLTSSNPTQQGLLFPPEVLRAAAEPYWASRRYEPDPRGNPAAREAVAAYYAGRTPPQHVDADAIYLTASTSEAYSLLFALLADSGDNLLAPNVTYPLFDYLAELRGLELRPYRMEEHNNWQIDGRSLLNQADERTRGVLLISPHNPTGAIVQQPIPALNGLGLPLICDEVFAPFSSATPATPPLAALHPTLPVFTLNGISKMFALPDMKLGWIALNDLAQAAYGQRLELINDTFLGANGLTQSLLPTLFREGGPFVETMRQQVRANLELGMAQLATCPQLTVRPPDGGYYLFPAVHGWDDEEELVVQLLERGVLLHPGYFYGDVPGTHLMLSALTEPQIFAAGVSRLCNALNEITRS